MPLDKADDEENRRRTLLRTSRISRGVQRSIKAFITFVLIPYPDNTGPGNKVMEPPFVPVHGDHDKTKPKEHEGHDISEVSYKSPSIADWFPCDPDYLKAKQPLS